MIARHSKVIIQKRRKIYSEKELCTRKYHQDVKKFKKWCHENDIEYKTYSSANLDDICVLSLDEYHLHDSRMQILEDCEDYFLDPKDYEIWCET